MFYDKAIIFVKSGNGGNGIVSFRREKYVPKGGPNGGNGGNGSNIYIEGDSGINSMIDFKYKKYYNGKSGENGKSNNKHGKNAKDIIIKVPVGTIVKDFNTKENIIDINFDKQKFLIAKGGKGGKGNASFMNNKYKAPKIAEKGDPGESKCLILELKLLADVALVGYPNVGKSTFISNISNLKSKVANYKFTTLEPKLGVININNKKIKIADIPGLIDGASKGKGLGHNFLKHIERTKIIIHIVDAMSEDLFLNFCNINKELKLYNDKLLLKKQIILINKIDIIKNNNKIEIFIKKIKDNFKNQIFPIFKISALKKIGFKEVINEIYKNIIEYNNINNNLKNNKNHKIINIKSEKTKVIIKKGIFILKGNLIESIAYKACLDNYDGINLFYKKLYYLGIIDLLKKSGIKKGDIVKISDIEFEYL